MRIQISVRLDTREIAIKNHLIIMKINQILVKNEIQSINSKN